MYMYKSNNQNIWWDVCQYLFSLFSCRPTSFYHQSAARIHLLHCGPSLHFILSLLATMSNASASVHYMLN